MLHEVITLLTGGLLLSVNLDYLVDIWSVLFPNEIRASHLWNCWSWCLKTILVYSSPKFEDDSLTDTYQAS